MIKLNEAIQENIKDLDKPARSKDDLLGISTGIKSLDRMIHGLRPGSLIVIGARPGMGKSSLALNMASAAAKQTNKGIAYFSYEMMYAEISMRLLASEAQIDRRKLKTKEFEDKDLIAISGAVQRLAGLPIFIEDSGSVDLTEIEDACLKIKHEKGLAMIVIDYFQLMPIPKSDIDETVKGLKELAVKFEVPVVVLSQLNRPKKNPSRRPMLKDLRDIGTLENLADIICLIYREDYYDAEATKKGIAEIIVPRNREGEPGTVEVKWIGSQLRFTED